MLGAAGAPGASPSRPAPPLHRDAPGAGPVPPASRCRPRYLPVPPGRCGPAPAPDRGAGPGPGPVPVPCPVPPPPPRVSGRRAPRSVTSRHGPAGAVTSRGGCPRPAPPDAARGPGTGGDPPGTRPRVPHTRGTCLGGRRDRRAWLRSPEPGAGRWSPPGSSPCRRLPARRGGLGPGLRAPAWPLRNDSTCGLQASGPPGREAPGASHTSGGPPGPVPSEMLPRLGCILALQLALQP